MKIIVTGMHRSGTSMVSGLLGLCGGYHGNNLISGLRDNPKGHFEDREFVNINDYILRKNGGSWRNPPAEITAVPVSRMRKFLEKWPTDRPVVLKDPRACFTIGAWRQLIHDRNLHVVFVMRSMYEIADSLAVRNRMSHHEALSLVRKYGDAFVLSTRGRKYHTTSYASYFGPGPIPWRNELGKLVIALGMKMPIDIGAIQEFVDPNLRHHDRS